MHKQGKSETAHKGAKEAQDFQIQENISILLREGHAECLDAVLSLRGKPLPMKLKSDRELVANEIERALLNCEGDRTRGAKEYATLAKSFSRLVSQYHTEDMDLMRRMTPELQALIPDLVAYLYAEVCIALDMGLPGSFIGRSLAKFDISEIGTAYYYLKGIAANGDEVVASNFNTIIGAALNVSDLNVAYVLAKDAKRTKDDIAEKYKDDEVVMANLSTIINEALHRADLRSAYTLLEDAKKTNDYIAEKYKDDEVVMANLPTIINAALGRGDLAYTLAENAKAIKEDLARIYKDENAVMADLSTIIHVALGRGNLKFAYSLAKDTKKTKEALAEAYKDDEVVMANLSTIINAALHKGKLKLAYDLAKDAKKTKEDLAESYKDDEVVMARLSSIINTALHSTNLKRAYDFAEEIKRGATVRSLRR
jgi:hypothetical protein